MAKTYHARDVQHSYARWWVLGTVWSGAVLALLGASLLFSFIHQADGRICAVLCGSLLLRLILLATFLVPHTSSSGHEIEEG